MMSAVQQPEPIEFAIGDHAFFAGITKAGKTFGVVEFIKHLLAIPGVLASGMKLYIVDTKNVGDFNAFPNHIYSLEAPSSLVGTEHNCLVWHPEDDENEEELESFLAMIFKAGKAFVIIDEVTVFCYGKRANKFSKQLAKLLKLGRGKYISVFTLTQELAGIPRQVWQSRHFFRFYIGAAYDTSLSNRKLGFSKKEVEKGVEPKHKYGFWYKALGERSTAQYFSSIQKFLKAA